MKRILILMLFLSKCAFGQTGQSAINECNNIVYTPMSAKPDFNTMLAGVKYAVIESEAKINGHVPAINALYDYLKALGFDNVTTLADHQPTDNIAEEIMVSIGFDYNLQDFSNITMSFYSPATEYAWEFSTKMVARGGVYSDPKANFGKALRDMHGFQKGAFNSLYTVQLAKRQTCWTEALLRSDIQVKGCDKLEGVYEGTSNTAQMSKYRVGLRRMNGQYYLIYFSGAPNKSNWVEGEIKATLESTATPSLFKAKWVMANKTENDNFYVSFENGIMNLIDPNSKKQIFIKMFPSMSENVSIPTENTSSGTGFALSSNGYIVTNYHVTNGANSIKVRGINGDFSKTFAAQVVIEDKNNDLSIIKINDSHFTSLGNIPYVIANKTVDVGSTIFVLGYPLRATMGNEVKLTNGIISAKSGFQGDVTSYQVNASVQPGNSGGPLFDSKGNIVGVINAKHLGAENVSYAIKTSYLYNLIDLMPNPPKLQTINIVSGKPLTEQVKYLNHFTYILEINN